MLPKYDKVHVGLMHLQDFPAAERVFTERKLGNFLHVWADQDEARFRRTLRWLKRHRIAFHLGGQTLPAYLTGQGYDRMTREMGELFLGRYIMSELGWVVYAPRDCMEELAPTPEKARRPEQWTPQVRAAAYFKGARDMLDARNRFVKSAAAFIGEARKETPHACIHTVESSTLHKYLIQAGADLPSLEMFPGETRVALAALRGCARAYGSHHWISHIAACCYSGWECELRPKRWKISLYESYIAGAPVISFEGCNWRTADYKRTKRQPRGGDIFIDKKFEKYQKVLSDFYAFTRKDRRPAGGPAAPLGLLHGHLDGWCGMWDRRVWGQYGAKEWEYGDAENGWEHFYDLYDRTRWDTFLLTSDANLTGHPPQGQADILPIEAPVEVLKKYRALACIGWNTMTPQNYRKLKQYVTAGGRLLMFTPQLSTHLKRTGPFRIIHGGNVADLFGVRIGGKSGRWSVGTRFVAQPAPGEFRLPVDDPPDQYRDAFCADGVIPLAEIELAGARMLACECKGGRGVETSPMLTEHRVGKGYTYLATPWCYPGRPGMRSFVNTLLKAFATAQLDKGLRIIAPAHVTYGVYPEGAGRRKVYLLNTDTDLDAVVSLNCRGKEKKVLLRPTECVARVV